MTGAEISSFNLPFDANYAGIAIDPTTGNLWYGSDRTANVIELTRTGTLLRTVDLASQGIVQGIVSGLTFDTAGNLFVASNNGVIYRTT